MQLAVQIALILTAAGIAIADYRERLIPLWLIVVFGIALLLSSFQHSNISLFLTNSFFNLLFVSFLLLSLTVFFSLKKKHLVRITDTYLGLGDIVLFYLLAFAFDFEGFVFFFTLSMLAALVIHLFVRVVVRKTSKEIPLATALMAVYIGAIVSNLAVA